MLAPTNSFLVVRVSGALRRAVGERRGFRCPPVHPGLCVNLCGLGLGVPETAADHFERNPGVDEFHGVCVAQLVDFDVDAGGGAVFDPPVQHGVVGDRAASAVDRGPEEGAVGVAGAGEVEA